MKLLQFTAKLIIEDCFEDTLRPNHIRTNENHSIIY